MPGPLWLPSETRILLKTLFLERQSIVRQTPGLWNNVALKLGMSRSADACRKRAQYLLRHASVSAFFSRIRSKDESLSENQANQMIDNIIRLTFLKKSRDDPWSIVEDMVLVDLCNQGLTWEDVARQLSIKTCSFRNSVQCRQRYARLFDKKEMNHKMNKGCNNWNADELKQLCLIAKKNFRLTTDTSKLNLLNSIKWSEVNLVGNRSIDECRQKWMRLPVRLRMSLLFDRTFNPQHYDFKTLTRRNKFCELNDGTLKKTVERLSREKKWPTENHINWIEVAADSFPDTDIRYLQYRWNKLMNE